MFMKTTIALLTLMALGLTQPAPAQEKPSAAAAQEKKKEW